VWLLLICVFLHCNAHGKKQSSPATRHRGAWVERTYSSYSFLTSAVDGGQWSASRHGLALPPGKGPPVPIVQEAVWAPEPVWTERLEEMHTVWLYKYILLHSERSLPLEQCSRSLTAVPTLPDWFFVISCMTHDLGSKWAPSPVTNSPVAND
jgi:hypothetical protein